MWSWRVCLLCYLWAFFLHIAASFRTQRHSPIVRLSQRRLYHPTSHDVAVNDDSPPWQESLSRGQWVKIICGASNQDLPLLRTLAVVSTLAGADCLDVCADLSVLTAVHGGISAAVRAAKERNSVRVARPLVMLSVNDAEDAHFRKAHFDPALCPPLCPRPCERVCPAAAIPPLPTDTAAVEGETQRSATAQGEGVIASKCYGCGRCMAVCPRGLILSRELPLSLDDVQRWLCETVSSNIAIDGAEERYKLVDAVEIHTSVGHGEAFLALWDSLGDAIRNNVRLLSISLQDKGDVTLSYMQQLHEIIERDSKEDEGQQLVRVWQTDGRSMSGDLGKGATHATVQFAKKLLTSPEHRKSLGLDRRDAKYERRIFAQLAGGTNTHTLSVVEREGLRGMDGFGGYSFGGFVRKEIVRLTKTLAERSPAFKIENHPDELNACVSFVADLVNAVKQAA